MKATGTLITNAMASIAVALLYVATANAETVDKSTPADPRGEVEIINVSGTVRVTGWDRAEVAVHANLGHGVEHLDVTRDGERVLIKVVIGHLSLGDTELNIHVPHDSRLVTSTVSADQTIADVHGAQRLQAVSGDIRTQLWSGEFEARTVSGEIIANGHINKATEKSNVEKTSGTSSHAHITTVSGNMELTNLDDELDLGTVSGEMTVKASTLSRAQIKTTNGDLHLSAALARGGRIDAETINGNLTFNFDGAVDADFDIQTFNGEIDNCFGPKAKRTHERGPGNELHFKEGAGLGQVRIKTLNGEVRICRK